MNVLPSSMTRRAEASRSGPGGVASRGRAVCGRPTGEAEGKNILSLLLIGGSCACRSRGAGAQIYKKTKKTIQRLTHRVPRLAAVFWRGRARTHDATASALQVACQGTLHTT